MDQNVQLFKSFARFSITHYIGQSVHPLICLSVGPFFQSINCFLAFTSDFDVTSPAQMFSSEFPHYPCPFTHNLGSLPSTTVFLPGSLFCRRALKNCEQRARLALPKKSLKKGLFTRYFRDYHVVKSNYESNDEQVFSSEHAMLKLIEKTILIINR